MIETITNSVFLSGALAGAALMGLAWLIFSKSSDYQAEVDRLNDQKKEDVKRILTLNDNISSLQGTVKGHETANAALTKDKAAAELALVEMREKFDLQEVDKSAVGDELKLMQEDSDKAEKQLLAAEDAYLDKMLIELKGFGTGTVKIAKKNGIDMRMIAVMPKPELNEVLDKAMVPKVARKYDLQKQAKKIIADMEKVTRA